MIYLWTVYIRMLLFSCVHQDSLEYEVEAIVEHKQSEDDLTLYRVRWKDCTEVCKLICNDDCFTFFPVCVMHAVYAVIFP